VNPKSRLSDVLSLDERSELVKIMLLDVLDVLKNFEHETFVLSTHPLDFLHSYDVEVIVDSRDLDSAVNSFLKADTSVVMSDLVLIREETLERFFNTPGDLVIAPGRRGGTNMVLVRNNAFKVSYHYCSFLKHVSIAKDLGLNVTVFDSFYASVDIDDRNDLLEVLIHGEGKRTHRYLKSLGFEIVFDKNPRLVRN
jgi:2-phospho-L-lactate guanylyltransferase